MKSTTTVLICTPFSNPASSMLRQLTGRTKIMYGRYDRSSYFTSDFEGKNGQYRIVLKHTGIDPLNATKAMEAAIMEHTPKLAFYIGVCESAITNLDPGEVFVRHIETGSLDEQNHETYLDGLDEAAVAFSHTLSKNRSINALALCIAVEKQVQERPLLDESVLHVSPDRALTMLFELL